MPAGDDAPVVGPLLPSRYLTDSFSALNRGGSQDRLHVCVSKWREEGTEASDAVGGGCDMSHVLGFQTRRRGPQDAQRRCTRPWTVPGSRGRRWSGGADAPSRRPGAMLACTPAPGRRFAGLRSSNGAPLSAQQERLYHPPTRWSPWRRTCPPRRPRRASTGQPPSSRRNGGGCDQTSRDSAR